MKRFIGLFIACASLAIMTSCSGSQKACAAYAKHDVINDDSTPQAVPLYKDIQ